MTLILNLTSAEEAHLTAAAQQAGLAPEALLRTLVNRLPLATEAPLAQKAGDAREKAGDAREKAIHGARGSLAHLGASVEDLHRQRQADRAGEQARDSGH